MNTKPQRFIFVWTRSRLCRARLLEAAERVARSYLPRLAPLGDRDLVAFDADIYNTTKEKTEDGKSGPILETREPHGPRTRSYWRLKQACESYRSRRLDVLSTPTFRSWLVGSKQQQSFAVDGNNCVPLADPPETSAQSNSLFITPVVHNLALV